MKILYFFCFSFLLLSNVVRCQTLTLLNNLNPGTASGLDDWYGKTKSIQLNNKIFLSATDGTTGFELYMISNNQLTLVKDINSGSGNSNPHDFIEFNNKIYFNASDGTNGDEIWVTDGTEAGTQLIIETAAGSDPSTGPGKMIVSRANKLYFSISGKAYVSDGTTAGTSQIINTSSVDFNEDYSNVTQRVCQLGQGIAFYGKSSDVFKLYKHDGTTLSELKSLTLDYFTDLTGLTEVSTGLLYATNDVFDESLNGLFVLDTTTLVISELLNSTTSFDISRVVPINGQRAIFREFADQGIYATDGTQSGTVKIAPGNFVLAQGEPMANAVIGSKVFFYGEEAFLKCKMYLSDGTIAGTSLVGQSTTPYLGNIIVNGGNVVWISGVTNGFNTQVFLTNTVTKSTTKIYTFSESATTEESDLIGVQDGKVYLGSSLKGQGKEVYSLVHLAVGISEPLIEGLNYALSKTAQNEYIIQTESQETISVIQFDILGRPIKSFSINSNEKFNLTPTSGISLLVLNGAKGESLYRIIE